MTQVGELYDSFEEIRMSSIHYNDSIEVCCITVKHNKFKHVGNENFSFVKVNNNKVGVFVFLAKTMVSRLVSH